MTARHDSFFDVPKTAAATSEGAVELPIAYYDSSYYLATFQVPVAPARQQLAGTGLEPVVVKRRAVVTLSFFKYRDTSIGPYHEVGMAVLAVPQGQPAELSSLGELVERPQQTTDTGFYVLDLPVSTPLACAAGRDIWGFPKFVTQLPISLDDKHFSAEVLDPDGASIMSLAGELGYSADTLLPGRDLITFSRLDGQLLRTHIRSRYQCQTHGGGTVQLRIGPSPHPMAHHLRALELESAVPKVVQTTEHFQSLLPAGKPDRADSGHPLGRGRAY